MPDFGWTALCLRDTSRQTGKSAIEARGALKTARSGMWRTCVARLRRYPRHALGSLNPQSVPFVTQSVTGCIPTRSMGTISVEADLCVTIDDRPTPSFLPKNRPNPAAFRVRHASPELTGVLSGARHFDDHGLFAVWAVGRGGFCFGFWRCRSGLSLARPCSGFSGLFADVEWRSLHNRLVPFIIASVRLTATDNRRYGLAQPAYRTDESLQGRLSLARHGSLQYTSNRSKGGMVQRTRPPSKAHQTAHRLKTSPCRTI